ncbi:MAG: dephospho-CoA kinase, partial [Actinobacteria bacterium]|nr:dephospho-CoA kinase [Actinomycetota bacterium]
TTAAKHLKKILDDALLINVDKVAKDIYCNNIALLEDMQKCFGSSVFLDDGSIDYRALGKIVFSSEKNLKKLNMIMFPEIKKSVGLIIKQNKSRKNIIIDAAVLFDAGLDKFCNITILVKAPFDRRKNLLKSRCSLSDFEIDQRLNGQKLYIDESSVSHVIENNGSKIDFVKKIEDIIKNRKEFNK